MKHPALLVPVALLGALGAPALAQDAGDWIVRAGATQVAPQEDADAIALNGNVLTLGGQTASLSVDNSTQLGLTVQYMLTPRLGVELLAATPFDHTAAGTGPLAGLNIARAKQLPPTVSAVYYLSAEGPFRPYVGAGLNATVFFDENVTGAAANTFETLGLSGGSVDIDPSLGLAFQAGFDVDLNDRWLLNGAVRWIDINTSATIKFDSGDVVSSDLEIDPWVYSLSLGYRF
jgi:outer membrane protein